MYTMLQILSNDAGERGFFHLRATCTSPLVVRDHAVHDKGEVVIPREVGYSPVLLGLHVRPTYSATQGTTDHHSITKQSGLMHLRA